MILNIIKFLAIGLAITAAIALGLIASQSPKKRAATGDDDGLLFSTLLGGSALDVPALQGVTMRDGWDMPVRDFGDDAGDKPLLILVHGSGWNGLQFSRLATALQDDAHVLVPDLRGHGATPERRGDVDYIGQMEDDLADLIAAKKTDGQRVVMAGHSSGGGLVVRFAGGTHGALLDEAILLAPFLKYNAPTTRENSGGWAHVLLRRVIGLSMLNTVGITTLNHLTVIQFAMPESVLDGDRGHLATTSYSYRLNTGFAPRSDYETDIAALPDFTLIAGAQDEAFYADRYEDVMSAVNDKGSYHILRDMTHLSIVDALATRDLIKDALQ